MLGISAIAAAIVGVFAAVCGIVLAGGTLGATLIGLGAMALVMAVVAVVVAPLPMPG